MNKYATLIASTLLATACAAPMSGAKVKQYQTFPENGSRANVVLADGREIICHDGGSGSYKAKFDGHTDSIEAAIDSSTRTKTAGTTADLGQKCDQLRKEYITSHVDNAKDAFDNSAQVTRYGREWEIIANDGDTRYRALTNEDGTKITRLEISYEGTVVLDLRHNDPQAKQMQESLEDIGELVRNRFAKSIR